MTLKNKKTAERYFDLLWGRHKEEGNIFLLKRFVSGNDYNNSKGNQQIIKPLQTSNLIEFLQENGSMHDFSVSPAIYNDTSRDYNNISGLYCFWAEFDYGTVGHKKRDLPFGSKDDCIRTIKNNYLNAGLNPNIIMSSGHGIHCYWLIDSNLVGQQTKKQIEQVNEWLFQIGIGINRNYYNEVKSVTSLMRSPYPAVNRKIASEPVETKMIFTKQKIYLLDKIRKKIAFYVVKKKKNENVALRKAEKHNKGCKAEVLRTGDINLLEADDFFITWLSDSNDLSYYRSNIYEFDSTSAKEAWIFKYLYLCNLDEHEIYDFCNRYMERHYHIFRTRKNIPDRIKRIQYEIKLALRYNTFPKTIKYEHRGNL